MNVAFRKAMTVDDYLAWAAAQGGIPRAELINGQVVFMPPEFIAHTRVKRAIFRALVRAVEEASVDAEVFTDGVTIPIDAHTAYEPDASVRLGASLSGDQMKVPDPVIVVEVLSPSSAHSDTSAKLIGYFKLASMRHYLVIDPQKQSVTDHARTVQDAVVARTLTSGALNLDPPGFTIRIGDLFR
jgi:Uma2 family endonuclease